MTISRKLVGMLTLAAHTYTNYWTEAYLDEDKATSIGRCVSSWGRAWDPLAHYLPP